MKDLYRVMEAHHLGMSNDLVCASDVSARRVQPRYNLGIQLATQGQSSHSVRLMWGAS